MNCNYFGTLLILIILSYLVGLTSDFLLFFLLPLTPYPLFLLKINVYTFHRTPNKLALSLFGTYWYYNTQFGIFVFLNFYWKCYFQSNKASSSNIGGAPN